MDFYTSAYSWTIHVHFGVQKALNHNNSQESKTCYEDMKEILYILFKSLILQMFTIKNFKLLKYFHTQPSQKFQESAIEIRCILQVPVLKANSCLFGIPQNKSKYGMFYNKNMQMVTSELEITLYWFWFEDLELGVSFERVYWCFCFWVYETLWDCLDVVMFEWKLEVE